MTGFKKWLHIIKNRKCFESDKLVIFLDDVNSNSVAIKGGNVFSITYGLLGNVSKTLYTSLLNLHAFM